MINDLDETIKQLLIKKAKLDPNEVEISFNVPDREWSATISKPRINLYLYDIRENHDLRGTEWFIEKGNNGMSSRKKSPSRINLSYLITVWASDIQDEHALIWRVLATLFKYSVLPPEIMIGSLKKQEYNITTLTAQPDGLLQNPADFWTALDNNLKPAINYVVTVPLDLEMIFEAALVKTATLDFRPPETDSETIVRISGRIREAGKKDKIISGAKLVASEAGKFAESDSEGKYSFINLKPGKYTIIVTPPGKKPVKSIIEVPAEDYDIEI